MKNILIIGCGLIGSSLLRSIADKKITKKIFIYEKSKSNIIKIKKLKLPCEVTSDLKKIILRSTKDGYNIKNKLRLTIGSNKENAKFIKAIKSIFN